MNSEIIFTRDYSYSVTATHATLGQLGDGRLTFGPGKGTTLQFRLSTLKLTERQTLDEVHAVTEDVTTSPSLTASLNSYFSRANTSLAQRQPMLSFWQKSRFLVYPPGFSNTSACKASQEQRSNGLIHLAR
jgi:hypothetical protein